MLSRTKPILHDPLPDGRTNPSLSVGKLYVIVTLVMDDYRVVDDRGEPILVPRSLFDVIDERIPSDWVVEEDEAEGWYWHGPPEFAAPGFFERWHDAHPRERQTFAEVYARLWQLHESQLEGQQLA